MNTHIKYPRTYHVPWSQGAMNDDKTLASTDHFRDMNVVVTEKMDGENTTMYSDHIHARSLDSAYHISREWVKGFWGNIRHQIPNGWRICGENLYAVHSIKYYDLESYFYGFSIWDDNNLCLSWDETLEWFDLLDITPVPMLYKGAYNEELIKQLWDEPMYNACEGYVIRNVDRFHYNDFSTNIAKFVRKGHVQTDEFWRHKKIEPNELRPAENNEILPCSDCSMEVEFQPCEACPHYNKGTRIR